MARMADRRPLRACIAVAALALLPYLLLPSKPAIYDAPNVVDNEAVRSAPLARLLRLDFWGVDPAERTSMASYRPLVVVTYAVQVRAFGPSAAVLHGTDLLLHALASALVVLLVHRLAGLARGAFWGGALFALHPVQSEAVCGVAGRADLLAGVFLFAALLLQEAAMRRRSPGRQLAVAALVGAALLSKEYAVVFPFLLVAVAVVRGRALGAERTAR
jgi:hypothetical protein